MADEAAPTLTPRQKRYIAVGLVIYAGASWREAAAAAGVDEVAVGEWVREAILSTRYMIAPATF